MTKSKPSPTILPAPVDTPESHSRRRFPYQSGVTWAGFSSPAVGLPFMKNPIGSARSVITKRGSRVRKTASSSMATMLYPPYFVAHCLWMHPGCVIPVQARVGSPAQRTIRREGAMPLPRHSA